MSSKLLSRRDLSFLLYEWLNVESLTRIPRYADHSRETFDAALDTCERIATDLFAPHNCTYSRPCIVCSADADLTLDLAEEIDDGTRRTCS